MTEARFQVEGGYPLYGEITAQRSKNAILPMIAAALIPENGKTVLHGVPDIADVEVALRLAQNIGARVEHDKAQHMVTIDASSVNTGYLPRQFSERFRGSVLFLGPLISRMGYVELPGSGGCDIGTRKIDFHHRGFARLGADVIYQEDGTTIIKRANKQLTGTFIYLDLPSHTGTENLMMGAALSKGQTIIENASVEPEVLDFGNFLNQMGAKISGLGTHTLVIDGVEKLEAIEYKPIPDRLVIGALVMSTAIAGGDVIIHGTEPAHLRLVFAKMEQMGVKITMIEDGHSIRVSRDPNKPLSPINITTHPFPGYPTDLQPCIAALATIAQGSSYIRERIFENRYDFVDGLLAMGADILISQNDVCIVNGVKKLKGAAIRAESIRAGAAVLLATLAARGESTIDNIYQIDRGHERIEEQLTQLGAKIKRISPQNKHMPEPQLP